MPQKTLGLVGMREDINNFNINVIVRETPAWNTAVRGRNASY